MTVRRWFKGAAGSEARRVVRFLMTGVLNTAFGYGVYLAGLSLGLAPVTALAIATGISAIFNYMTVSTLVFGQRTMVKFPIFTGVYLVSYLFNAGLLYLATAMGIRPWLAQLCVLPLVVCANYGLMRLWVFRSAVR